MAGSSSMPQFLYPGAKADAYTYNYLDNVNVTWTWNSPPDGAKVGLILWLKNAGSADFYAAINDTSLPTKGSKSCLLDYADTQYTALGHFNLIAHYSNGTIVGGPNSNGIAVIKDDGLSSVCQNCASQESIQPPGPTSTPTAVTTFISAGTINTSPPSATVTSPGPTAIATTEQQTSGLSAGAIAGIAVSAVVAAVALTVLAIFLLLRRRQARQARIGPLGIESIPGYAGNYVPTYGGERKEMQRSEYSPYGNRMLVSEKDGPTPTTELPADARFELGTER